MQQLDNIPAKEIVTGISGKYIHGASTSFGYVKIQAGSILPTHQHPHEQITYILDGELELTVGEDIFVMTRGSIQVIPSDTPHCATARIDCTVIDIFSPPRDDYR